MTVCIAGICERAGNSIIAVSDRKLSAVAYSGDSMVVKVFGLSNNWGIMWASEKVTTVPSVLYAAASACEDKTEYPDMVAAFQAGLQKCLRDKVTQGTLAKFNIDLPKFLSDGKAMFTESEHTEIVKKLMNECTESQFLIFGFDKSEEPHIFVVTDQDAKVTVEEYDSVGFAAIGSGAEMAESSLFFHEYSRYNDINTATYLLCQAKFMAESAEGVGEDTFCFVHRPRENTFPLQTKHIQEIRKFWQRSGKPRIPKTTRDFISGVLQRAEKETSEYMQKTVQPSTSQTSKPGP